MKLHRSTFGDMLITIKDTFQTDMFFGFTGTPIHEENAENEEYYSYSIRR